MNLFSFLIRKLNLDPHFEPIIVVAPMGLYAALMSIATFLKYPCPWIVYIWASLQVLDLFLFGYQYFKAAGENETIETMKKRIQLSPIVVGHFLSSLSPISLLRLHAEPSIRFSSTDIGRRIAQITQQRTRESFLSSFTGILLAKCLSRFPEPLQVLTVSILVLMIYPLSSSAIFLYISRTYKKNVKPNFPSISI